jgi:hypothetical protein
MELGVNCRDDAAKNLTAEQISKAQQIASDCQKNNFKNCLTISEQAESIKCAQFFDVRRETAISNLLGKPLFSYKRDELIAMKEQVLNCDLKTEDEIGRRQAAGHIRI